MTLYPKPVTSEQFRQLRDLLRKAGKNGEGEELFLKYCALVNPNMPKTLNIEDLMAKHYKLLNT